jgi:ribosomal protein S17
MTKSAKASLSTNPPRKQVGKGVVVAKKATKSVIVNETKKATKKFAAKKAVSAASISRPTSYSAAIKRISKDFGVKVGPAQLPGDSDNPYRLPKAQADKVLKRTGILTANGKLGAIFK